MVGRGLGRRPAAILAAVLLTLVLGGAVVAWFALDPGPLHRIVVTTLQPEDAAHPFWQIAIEQSDTYTYSTDSYTRHGRIAFAPYARRFRSIAESRWTQPPRFGAQPGVSFWAVGTRRTLAPFVGGSGSDHGALRAFARSVYDAVMADQRRADAPRTAALNGLDGLRSIEMRGRGAMCGRCLWTIRIAASGRAFARTDQPFDRRHPIGHTASLAWGDLTTAFRRAGLGNLESRYPVHASDVAGVAFQFTFPRASYAIDAPDYARWPASLRHAYLEIMTHISRARWTPAIDSRSLPDPASMRLWAERAG